MINFLPNLRILTVFLKNRNFISKIKRSNVTDYAALRYLSPMEELYLNRGDKSFQTKTKYLFFLFDKS